MINCLISCVRRLGRQLWTVLHQVKVTGVAVFWPKPNWVSLLYPLHCYSLTPGLWEAPPSSRSSCQKCSLAAASATIPDTTSLPPLPSGLPYFCAASFPLLLLLLPLPCLSCQHAGEAEGFLPCTSGVKHCRIKNLPPLSHTSINPGLRKHDDELLLWGLVIAGSHLSSLSLLEAWWPVFISKKLATRSSVYTI